MNNIIKERLDALNNGTVNLDKGSHTDFESGHCAMEVVSWLAGQGFTDAPECASPVLRGFTISLNDQWDAVQRQKLIPFLPRMVGTNSDGKEEARSFLALDWLIRTHTPAWLDLAGLTAEAAELRSLRRIVDLTAAEAAEPVVRGARLKASAAWAAAGAVAGDAAGNAAWAATWAAAWAAAGAVAGDAAGNAARDVARDVAGVAAEDALRTTVEALQASALDLLDRMIDPDVEIRRQP